MKTIHLKKHNNLIKNSFNIENTMSILQNTVNSAQCTHTVYSTTVIAYKLNE